MRRRIWHFAASTIKSFTGFIQSFGVFVIICKYFGICSIVWYGRSHGAKEPGVNEHPAGGRLSGDQREKNLCAGKGPQDSLHPSDRQMDVPAETDRLVDRAERGSAASDERFVRSSVRFCSPPEVTIRVSAVLRELFEERTKPASFFLNTVGSSAGFGGAS